MRTCQKIQHLKLFTVDFVPLRADVGIGGLGKPLEAGEAGPVHKVPHVAVVRAEVQDGVGHLR